MSDDFFMPPRVSRSDLLTVVVERDLEESPDDEKAWVVILACEGAEVPEHFGGGYLHPPVCDCEVIQGQLCNVGWLQEFVTSVGAFPLIEDALTPYIDKGPVAPFSRFRLTGRMVSERYDSTEGTDYDERFDVEKVLLL